MSHSKQILMSTEEKKILMNPEKGYNLHCPGDFFVHLEFANYCSLCSLIQDQAQE